MNRLPSVSDTIDRFERVLHTDIGIALKPHALGDLFGVLQLGAKQIGLSGNPVGAPSSDTDIAGIARTLGLKVHSIELLSDWWRHDHGVVISAEVSSGRPVLLCPNKFSGGMRITGPERLGDFRPVDALRAAQIDTHAYAIYAELPSQRLDFKAVLFRSVKLHSDEIGLFIALTVLIAIFAYSVPVASGLIVNHAVPHGEYSLLVAIVTAVVAANLLMFALRYTTELLARRLEGNAGVHLQAGLLHRIAVLPLSFFSRQNSADLMRRVVGLETARRSVIRLATTSLIDLTTLLVGIAVLIWYFPIGGFVVLTAALFSLLLAFSLARRSFTAFLEGESMTSNVLTIVYELVSHISSIRIAGAELNSFQRWRDDFVEMRRRTVRSTQFTDTYSAFQQGMNLFLMSCIFGLVTYNLASVENASIGFYVAFVSSLSIVTGSVASLSAAMLSAYGLIPLVQRAAPILESPPAIPTRRVPKIEGRFSIQKIVYRYSNELPPVLDEITLEVREGQYIGIVGASGCGKSTLIRCILGMISPERGKILVDGVDIQEIDREAARKQFGVVLQDTRLFPGSLLENLAVGRLLDQEVALAALDRVGLGAYIRSLPMGMNTLITESASTFSMGQIQLISLARALIGNPKVLIMDEGSSALDQESQRIVTETLASLKITRLIATHRVETLSSCDRVIVIDSGVVVEEGSPAELLAARGRYYSLVAVGGELPS